ncbi:hypothetical protein JDN40_07225 [Rhodomicrobium vannielii ATCC 17100]|nr:hypothetical protein [Rhodomicrobium vannielii]MBJ7533891.1 hypothetical protein [Rhodomicrobium vannielii ATCC 17100]
MGGLLDVQFNAALFIGDVSGAVGFRPAVVGFQGDVFGNVPVFALTVN